MFDVMFVVIPIFIGIVFIFVLAMIISPKFRGKMMARQVKSMKYMLDESKKDLEAMGGTAINVKKNIVDINVIIINILLGFLRFNVVVINPNMVKIMNKIIELVKKAS